MSVGVAIAADTCTAAWLPADGTVSAPLTRDQTPAGVVALQQRLAATRVTPDATLVVMAATGSYWVALAVALHEAG